MILRLVNPPVVIWLDKHWVLCKRVLHEEVLVNLSKNLLFLIRPMLCLAQYLAAKPVTSTGT